MDRAAVVDTLTAWLKDSSEHLVLVEDGTCLAASRPAIGLLGLGTGSINVLFERIIPSSARAKLKAAWTRAHKRMATTATIDTKTGTGPTQLRFFRLDDGLHLLRIEITQPHIERVNEATKLGMSSPPVAQAESVSHPELPEAYGRQAFFGAIAKLAERSDSAGERCALIAIEVTSADRIAYWQDSKCCKAVLLRLNDVVRGHDTIAHLGGAHFGIVQHGIRNESDMKRLEYRIIDIMGEPFLDDGMPSRIELAIAARVFECGNLTQVVAEDFLTQAPSPVTLSDNDHAPMSSESNRIALSDA